MPLPSEARGNLLLRVGAIAALLFVATMIYWAMSGGTNADPMAAGVSPTSAVVDIGILVFREGLESILVISVITASMVGSSESYRRPIAIGIAVAFVATLITWMVAVSIVDSLSASVSALQLQAATGLLAIVVLLVIMNWFFHKLYWTGWISLHNRRKKALLQDAAAPARSKMRVLIGFGFLGFTSMYREGFEVVLFLQSYRLKLGETAISRGVILGLLLTVIVGVITFAMHRRLPFRRMLVWTGVMLGVVLLVMVGEEAQEMQLAHWISTTPVPSLQHLIPDWVGLWFAVFPTVETLVAQAIAATLVLGSYIVVRTQVRRTAATN